VNNLETTIEEIIEKRTVGFISSVDEDGYPNIKAMLPPVKREGIKTFYWHTNSSSIRVKQYKNNPKASIYFCDESSFQGIMLKGRMEVLDDKKTKEEIWQDGFNMYYNGGATGGDFIIIKFTAINGRYYGNFHSEDFEVKQF